MTQHDGRRTSPRGGRRPHKPRNLRAPGSQAAAPSRPIEKGVLSKDWDRELTETARREAPRAKALIAKALESFIEDDYPMAAKYAEEAKSLATRSGRIRELLGLCLYRSERWHDASRELLTYRRLTGRKDQNHVIADCYRALGRFDKAVEICREVSPKDVEPEIWTEVVIVAASSIADRGDVVRALAEMARADLEPKRVEGHTLRAWYVRAGLLEKVGDRAQAKKTWERIYAEDPDFYDVATKIGRS